MWTRFIQKVSLLLCVDAAVPGVLLTCPPSSGCLLPGTSRYSVFIWYFLSSGNSHFSKEPQAPLSEGGHLETQTWVRGPQQTEQKACVDTHTRTHLYLHIAKRVFTPIPPSLAAQAPPLLHL